MEVPVFTVTVLGGMSWPEAFNVPFRQRLAPTVMRPAPLIVVPGGI